MKINLMDNIIYLINIISNLIFCLYFSVTNWIYSRLHYNTTATLQFIPATDMNTT